MLRRCAASWHVKKASSVAFQLQELAGWRCNWHNGWKTPPSCSLSVTGVIVICPPVCFLLDRGLPPAPLTRLPPSLARLRRVEGGRQLGPAEPSLAAPGLGAAAARCGLAPERRMNFVLRCYEAMK